MTSNVNKTEEAAKKAFPNEQWDDAALILLKHKDEEFQIPNDIKNVKVAHSRLTGKKGDERVLAKEIRQAKVLTERGAVVYLLPKSKNSDGEYLSGADALVNGKNIFYENKRSS
jgi:hypothetical protein